MASEESIVDILMENQRDMTINNKWARTKEKTSGQFQIRFFKWESKNNIRSTRKKKKVPTRGPKVAYMINKGKEKE